MKMSELKQLSPELADIIQQLGPNITRGAIWIDDELVHGTPPPPDQAVVSAESYLRMREYAAKPIPKAAKMVKA